MNDSVRPVRQIVIDEDHDSVLAAMMGFESKEDYVTWLEASAKDSRKIDDVAKG